MAQCTSPKHRPSTADPQPAAVTAFALPLSLWCLITPQFPAPARPHLTSGAVHTLLVAPEEEGGPPGLRWGGWGQRAGGWGLRGCRAPGLVPEPPGEGKIWR